MVQKFAETLESISVRSIRTVVQDTHAEGDSSIQPPLTISACYAVVKNPWVRQGTRADLTEYAAYAAPLLARTISERLLNTYGSAERIKAFGKAAVVGLNGEIEHGSALIHTPYFGNIFRELLGGSSIICFSESRTEPSESIRAPLWHKNEASTRDYYQSLDVHLPDAPHADEIIVMGLASNGPRPHPRIGDRTTDPDITIAKLQGVHA